MTRFFLFWVLVHDEILFVLGAGGSPDTWMEGRSTSVGPQSCQLLSPWSHCETAALVLSFQSPLGSYLHPGCSGTAPRTFETSVSFDTSLRSSRRMGSFFSRPARGSAAVSTLVL